MPEEKKKDQMTCNCGTCACCCGCGMGMGMRGGYGFRLLRLFFAFVVLVVVFIIGVTIGELRGMLETRYSSYHMMGGGYGQMHPMMPANMNGGTMPDMATTTTQ